MTGATGYVGGRLVPLLLERGHEVRSTTSRPGRPPPWWGAEVETVVMDALDADQVAAACRGVDAVYYLMHGMGGDDFARTDREAASNMAAAVRAQGVGRVVYLSGIIPDVPDEDLSEHLRSRQEVERTLAAIDTATVVVLRAAVLLGSGSTSFEIIRQVSQRLPLHTIPTWMDSTVQPIAVVDVLEALAGALGDDVASGSYDIGGPDRLRYSELLDIFTTTAGMQRPQVEVPLLPTGLVGTLVASLTDVPRPTVEALVESLRHDMVAADDRFREVLLPAGHQLVGLEDALRRSTAAPAPRPEEADPMGRLPQDPTRSSGDPGVLARLIDTVKDVLPHSS